MPSRQGAPRLHALLLLGALLLGIPSGGAAEEAPALAGVPDGAPAGAVAGGQAAPGQGAPGALPPPGSFSRRLSRFEIIAVGSLPVTLFTVNFGFDTVAWFRNGFDSAFAPWPFKGSNASSPDAAERGYRIAATLGLSAAIALLDALLEPPRGAAGAELDSGMGRD